MSKKVYFLFLVILSVLLSLILKPAYAEELKIRIITENYPPYNYLENGELKGINAETVKKIISHLKKDIKIEVMQWDEAYKIAMNEKNAAVFSAYKIDERKDLFKWVGPLSKHQWSFFAKKDSNIKIEKLEDAAQYSIGVYNDDACELFLKSQKFEKIISVTNDEENALKLMDGVIDLWIGNEETARFRAAKAGVDFKNFNKAFDIKSFELYIAFNKETDDEIINEFQRAHDEIKSASKKTE